MSKKLSERESGHNDLHCVIPATREWKMRPGAGVKRRTCT